MLSEERKTELRDNFLRVCEQVERAKARRGGDTPVSLLAASKTKPAEDIVFLARECGMKLCGENHAQEFRDKFPDVSGTGCRMDFIGHLQTNKVKYVVGRAGLIHSLDSIAVAEEIDRQAKKLGVIQDVLIEINVGAEESKTGIIPCMLDSFSDEIERFSSINVRGIMAMTPKCEKKEENRKFFKESYRIFLDFCEKKSHNIREGVLSMGMSDSFEIAIEEGASLVRVGSSIFGARDYFVHPEKYLY